MNVLILSRIPELYSTRRLVEVAQRRGHHVDVIDPLLLGPGVIDGRFGVLGTDRDYGDVDLVIPRVAWWAAEHTTKVTAHFERCGAAVLNEAVAIARAKDKFRGLAILAEHGIAVPDTLVARDGASLRFALDKLPGPPVILKFSQGTQGMGVMLAESAAAAESIVAAFAGLNREVLVQEYVEEARGRDRRYFVLSNRVIAVMQRTARDGDFRSNLHCGATSEAVEPLGQEAELALRAVEALGLDVAGVDILESKRGPLVLEVNASPGLEGIERATGIDIATQVLECGEFKHAENGRSKP